VADVGLGGWANRITLGRGVLAIVIWALLHAVARADTPATGLWWTAFALFVFAAGTDSVDGWVARRRGEVSAFGRVADPLVDKILILGSAFFLLAIPGVPDRFPPWAAAVMLLRELLVTALRAQIEADGGNFQAVAWGKAKMVSQCVAIGSVILSGAGVGFVRAPLDDPFGPAAQPHELTLPWLLCVVAAALTAVSGVEYVVRAYATLKSHPPPPPAPPPPPRA
jgi:CDP-diacylglycerol--glycerol-3-phosphate 3-phosphatidyltransferase